MIYFILAEELNRVKIGYTSSSVDERYASLQISSPCELKILYFTHGNMKREKHFHNLFAEYHIRGEWFEYKGKLKFFLMELEFPCIQEIKINPQYNEVQRRNQKLWAKFLGSNFSSPFPDEAVMPLHAYKLAFPKLQTYDEFRALVVRNKAYDEIHDTFIERLRELAYKMMDAGNVADILHEQFPILDRLFIKGLAEIYIMASNAEIESRL